MARNVSLRTAGTPRSFIRLLKFKVLAIATIAGLFALQGAYAQNQPVGIVPPKPSSQPSPAPQPGAIVTGNGIEYHGGPVMISPHNVYFIWYGNWSGSAATTILPDFITGLNGSNYFNTNTTYGDANNDIANTISMAGQIFDNYSQGKDLGSIGVQNAVSAALNAGLLPTDANGSYLGLTSPDVTESTFCHQFCAYHTRATLNGADIKYGFVGNPATQCPNSCEDQRVSPNGNEGADAMADFLAHEINETVTDPHLDAWFHNNTAGEVGDLCNFNFGNRFYLFGGASANITLGGRNYLIQQNWVNDSGGF